MPFPVTKLPYGSCVRLSELSFPAERYQLQIAAGNFNICPQKYPKVIRYTVARFRNCSLPGKIIATGKIEDKEHESDTPIDVNGNTVAECCRFVELNDFNCETLDSDAMKNVVLSPYSLFLPLCHLSTEFLTKLSTMVCSSVNYIDMKHSTFDSTLADLLTLFPHAENINIDLVCKPLLWLDDLVSAPGCKLQKLQLIGTFEALTTFTVADLVKYYETRGGIFELTLQFTNMTRGRDETNPGDVSKRLENFEKLRLELKLKLRVEHVRTTIICHGLRNEPKTQRAGPQDEISPVKRQNFIQKLFS